MKEKTIQACGSKRKGGCPLGGDEVFVVKIGDNMFYVKTDSASFIGDLPTDESTKSVWD